MGVLAPSLHRESTDSLIHTGWITILCVYAKFEPIPELLVSLLIKESVTKHTCIIINISSNTHVVTYKFIHVPVALPE